MKQTRIIIIALSLFAAALCALPESRANETKSAAKNITFNKDVAPNMHLRGAAMEVKTVYPDGRAETLLNVPRYDFSWQTNYSLKQPMTAPKGTRFLVTAWFDNSAKNKFNPDPTTAVRWGEPTYDEMLVCFLDYTQDAKATATAGSGQATQR